jgi:hypothetical protein
MGDVEWVWEALNGGWWMQKRVNVLIKEPFILLDF